MTETNITRRAQMLGKWLWLLFLLIIPSVVADVAINVIPSLSFIGEIISVCVSLTYALILLKLSFESKYYRAAGFCVLVTTIGNAVVTFAFGEATESIWTLLITLPIMVVSIVGEYHEYNAHGEVLYGIDSDLQMKWHKLWSLYVGTMVGMLAGLVVTFVIPLLGLVVVLVAAIGTIVVGILKLVYLYRTAMVFRNYKAEKSTV